MLLPSHLLIDGVRTILAEHDGGWLSVVQYSANEMLELFSSDEVGRLCLGETIVHAHTGGSVRYTDMVASTLIRIRESA